VSTIPADLDKVIVANHDLPFEGADAISTLRLDLPRDTNAFDFESISDVILRPSDAAREASTDSMNGARRGLGLIDRAGAAIRHRTLAMVGQGRKCR
jgi:hypothetical protein